MRGLTDWTGGLVGQRDPAQPLLTMYAGGGRVELSGATTANWVAKSANLLVDGLGGPQRVGLLLPLHWQTLALLLAGVATGATVVVAERPAGLAGCGAAFALGEHAEAALSAGVDEVLALSGHPLGAPLPSVPAMVSDYAREVPSYADHWGGSATQSWVVEVGGNRLGPLPTLGLSPADRVLASVDPADPGGLAALLAVLHEAAALVLVPSPTDHLDVAATAAAERVTATLGCALPHLPSLSSA